MTNAQKRIVARTFDRRLKMGENINDIILDYPKLNEDDIKEIEIILGIKEPEPEPEEPEPEEPEPEEPEPEEPEPEEPEPEEPEPEEPEPEEPEPEEPEPEEPEPEGREILIDSGMEELIEE